MRKVLLAIITSLAIFGVAFYEGWSSYKLYPEGVFLVTPMDWCTPRTNSFGVNYSFVIFVAIVAAIIAAIIGGIIYFYSKEARTKQRGKIVMQISILVTVIQIALSNLSGFFESMFPMQPDPACIGKSTTPNPPLKRDALKRAP